MINVKKEKCIEKHLVCPTCKGIARYVESDYFYNKDGSRVIWTKLYKCNDCGKEYLKELNSILS